MGAMKGKGKVWYYQTFPSNFFESKLLLGVRIVEIIFLGTMKKYKEKSFSECSKPSINMGINTCHVGMDNYVSRLPKYHYPLYIMVKKRVLL